jgi:hypothetical protein
MLKKPAVFMKEPVGYGQVFYLFNSFENRDHFENCGHM